MKKILFIFLLFLMIDSASAKTYYSSYGEYSEFLSNSPYVENTDLIEVEKREIYRWYKENKVNGGYFQIGKNDPKYPNIDINDTILGKYTAWSTTVPEKMEDRNIETRSVYYYQDMKEVRYLDLLNMQGSYGSFRISELEIFAGNTKINYSINCTNCNNDFFGFINNGNYYENKSIVYNGGNITVDLNNYFPADSLTIKMYLYDTGYNDKTFKLNIRNDSSNFFSKNEALQFTYSDLNEIKPFTYTIKNMNIDKPAYYNEKFSETYIESTKTRKVREEKQYRYQDRLYGYYNLVKEYAVEYSDKAIDDYNICDRKDSIMQHRYRSRDFITISDDLKITDSNFNVSSLYTSNVDVNVKHNIDLKTNGTYDIDFITSFTTISAEVVVEIEDNEKDKIIEELQKKIEEYQKEIELLNSMLNIKEEEIQNLNNTIFNNNEYIKQLENQIQNFKKEVAKLELTIEDGIVNIEKLNKIISEKEKEIEELKLTIEDGVVNLEQLNEIITKKEKEVEELKLAIEAGVVNIEKLDNIIAKKEEEIQNLNKTILDIQKEIESLNKLVTDKNAEIENLNTSILSKDKQVENLNKELLELKKQNEENNTSIDSLNKELSNKKDEIDSLKNKVNELINISTSLENNNKLNEKETKDKINKYIIEIEKLQNELKNKEYEIENKECIETSSKNIFANNKTIMLTGVGFVIFGLILGIFSLIKK